MVVFQNMLGFLLMMAMGLVARRTGILARETLPRLSSLVANVTFPCMIIASFTGATDRMGLAEAGNAFVAFAALVAVLVGMAWIMPRLLRYPRHLQPCANLCFWLTNIGYMGMALLSATHGDHAKVYVMLYLLPSNLMLYTYAIWLLRRGAFLEAGEAETGEAARSDGSSLRGLLNPGVVTTVAGGILYFAGVTMPETLLVPLERIGGVTVPLAMMVAGAQLADVSFREMLTDWRLLAFCTVKMLLVPIAVLLVLRLFVADVDLFACCMAVLSMPTGVLVSALALLYQPNAAAEATRVVALTTVMSAVTVPLVCLAVGL